MVSMEQSHAFEDCIMLLRRQYRHEQSFMGCLYSCEHYLETWKNKKEKDLRIVLGFVLESHLGLIRC